MLKYHLVNLSIHNTGKIYLQIPPTNDQGVYVENMNWQVTHRQSNRLADYIIKANQMFVY